MSDRTTRKPYAAPSLPRFDGGTIVPTRLVLAVYVKEQAGKLSVVVDDKAGDPKELFAALFLLTQAMHKRMARRRVQQPAVRL